MKYMIKINFVTKIKNLINFILSKLFKLIPSKSILFQTYTSYSIEEKLSCELPYTNINFIKFLIDFTKNKNNLNLFEYGSGSSTLFFEKHFTQVYSVENNESWYKEIKRYSKKANIYFVPGKHSLNPIIKSSKFGYKKFDFNNYVNFINEIGTKFDVVFIDGRARESCLKIVINYLKPNGLIVLDNSGRKRYKTELELYKKKYKYIDFKGFSTFIPLPSKKTVIFT